MTRFGMTSSKYLHAARHAVASATGWIRLRKKHPEFALEILRRRWNYFTKRAFEPGGITPDGFSMDTPDGLVAYWSMFVEQELHDDLWTSAIQAAGRPLVVDVGANAGLFSHLAFCLNPQVELVAFEPLPEMVHRINDLRKRNRMNLSCIPKAVGRETGMATLESAHGYEGTSRIRPPGMLSAGGMEVPVTTLDMELRGSPVLVMKIDVEGFEEEVLAGATETLANTKFLIIEAHNAERREKLSRLLGSGWSRRKLGPSDYLFYRP